MMKDKTSGATKLIQAKHAILMPDASNNYNGMTKKNFSYVQATHEHEQVTTYADGSKQANAMSIEEFLAHPQVEPIVTNTSLVSSIDYVLTTAGNEPIEESEAFFNSRAENFDLAKKPVSKRPGKRAAPTPAEPATTQVPRTMPPSSRGGSSSGVAPK